jgi:hypothetical protein
MRNLKKSPRRENKKSVKKEMNENLKFAYSLSECLDIGKTIKPLNSKIR